MSTHYGIDNVFWKGHRLYRKSKIIEAKPQPLMEITPCRVDPTMHYVVWPDGVMSADRYNLTRAKDHAVVIALADMNKEEVPLDI